MKRITWKINDVKQYVGLLDGNKFVVTGAGEKWSWAVYVPSGTRDDGFRISQRGEVASLEAAKDAVWSWIKSQD
jgi:hypothetical protein